MLGRANVKDTPSSARSQLHQGTRPIHIRHPLVALQRVAIEPAERPQRHTVYISPVGVGIEFFKFRVSVKKVDTVEVMVRYNPFLTLANSLLHELVHFGD